MPLKSGNIGEPITCGADSRDTLTLSHRENITLLAQDGSDVRSDSLALFARGGTGDRVVSIYMDRARVEELATYLMYWLHETKDAE